MQYLRSTKNKSFRHSTTPHILNCLLELPEVTRVEISENAKKKNDSQ